MPLPVNFPPSAGPSRDAYLLAAVRAGQATWSWTPLAMPGGRVVQRMTAESLTSTTVNFGTVAAGKGMVVPAASAAMLRLE